MWWRRRKPAQASDDEIERLVDAVTASMDDPPALVHASRRLLNAITPTSVFWPITLRSLAFGLGSSSEGDRASNLEEARQALLEAAATDSQPAGWAHTQSMLGSVHDQLGKYGVRSLAIEEAIRCYLRALGVRERTGSERANDEYNLAGLYRRRVEGNPDDNRNTAIVHYRAALQGYGQEVDPVFWSDIQHELGLCYLELWTSSRRANVDEAIACFERALRVRSPERDTSTWAYTMMALSAALAQQQSGQHADNVEKSLKCLHLALEKVDVNHDPKTWADLHYNIAVALGQRKRGDRAENAELALDHLHRTLEVYTPETDPESWLDVHHALGAAYGERLIGDRTANLRRAIEHFQQAFAAANSASDPHRWGNASRSLGIAYLKKFQHEHHYARVVKYVEDSLRDRGRYSVRYWRRGDRVPVQNEHDLADLTAARKYLEDSLRVRGRDQVPAEWARTVETIAAMRLDHPSEEDRAADIARAIHELDQAAEVHRELSADDQLMGNRVAYVEALRRLGTETGRDTTAEQIQTLDFLLQHESPESQPRSCRLVAGRKGELLAGLGRWTEAADAFAVALHANELLHIGPVTRAAREAEFSDGRVLARWASYVLARLGRLEEAVVVLENGRARALGELIGGDETALIGLRETEPALLDSYLRAREQLRAAQDSDVSRSLTERRHLANQLVPPDEDAAELSTIADHVRTLRDKVDSLVGQIRQIEGYADFRCPADLKTIAAAVEPDCPLAYINTTPWGTATLLLTYQTRQRPGIRVIWADDFTEEDVTKILMRPANPTSSIPLLNGFAMRQLGLVETVFEDGSWALTLGPVFGAGVAQRTGRDEDGGMWVFGKRVVAPLAATLRGLDVASVALVACGALGAFPVHTAAHDDGPAMACLLDVVDVAFAPSARVLAGARAWSRCPLTSPSLFGAANPLPHDAPLAFAEQELERVRLLFNNATTFVGQEATRSAVVTKARGASYVHLACHGSYELGDYSPRLQFENGLELSLVDIVRDRPFANARLVTLSACQTAIPSIRGSFDEVDGLPAGILASGTPAVVGTLWPVDDLSTTLLMERFYTLHLRGDPATGEGPLSPHRALSRAQRWLARVTAKELHDYFRSQPELQTVLEHSPSSGRYPASEAARHALHFGLAESNERPFAQSWFWAPFVLIGA